MDEYHPRPREPRPLTPEEVECLAAGLLRSLCRGAVTGHYRQPSDDMTDAVVMRVRQMAREEGVRLVVKREMENGRVRWRLRLRKAWE